MPEQRYRITITLKAEDLTREGGKDRGSEAVVVNNEVGADTRHQVEKALANLLVGFGDEHQEKRKKSGAT